MRSGKGNQEAKKTVGGNLMPPTVFYFVMLNITAICPLLLCAIVLNGLGSSLDDQLYLFNDTFFENKIAVQ